MNADTPARPLSLHLHAPGAELSSGTAVRALGDARATLDLAGERVDAHLALPDRSLAEARWVADKVVRSVSDLVGIESVRLELATEVADDTAVSIALDLHNRVGAVELVGREDLGQAVARVGALEDGYRGWVDEDPATRTSLQIAADITRWAGEQDGVSCEVLAEDKLEELGLRLLLAVGQGSSVSPARLVIARYTPKAGDKQEEAPLMLLGKGITFDTGGINVKPYEGFVPMMKNDMAGSALAFHLFKGLVEGGYPEPVVLVIPTCENSIGSASMRPGAVVRSYRGHTVRIDHTDAEGRLVLADGLAYASELYQPKKVICFATLTTAALIAYGPYATPVHFADDELEARLRAASIATGEDLHYFPERLWHFEANRDQEADLRNTARLPGNASRGAGSRNAAHFLKHFTDSALVHFDIFASTWNWAGDAPGTGYGATGAPLRTLLRALEG